MPWSTAPSIRPTSIPTSSALVVATPSSVPSASRVSVSRRDRAPWPALYAASSTSPRSGRKVSRDSRSRDRPRVRFLSATHRTADSRRRWHTDAPRARVPRRSRDVYRQSGRRGHALTEISGIGRGLVVRWRLPEHQLSAAARRAIVVDHRRRLAGQRAGVFARVTDRCARQDVLWIAAVPLGHPARSSENPRGVHPADPRPGVGFVDHDERAVRVKRRPPVVTLEVLVQSRDVGDDDVRLLADPRFRLGVGVAVVDADRDVDAEVPKQLLEFAR